jgi:GntR family transcriptional regulator, arabinose operon transcriptional repressor
MTFPKHRQIYAEVKAAIVSGKYHAGQRLPSEAQLVKQFQTSRPTVARALRDLQQEGFLDRHAGSGTFVSKQQLPENPLVGLIVPKLGETEIFDPICRELARSSQLNNHSLLWGSTEEFSGFNAEEQLMRLCDQFIARKVTGVYFAPLELTPDFSGTNERIVQALDHAKIPVVLLDRDLYAYPRRSRYDKVGIDNRLAGHIITEHLLKLGCRKIAFVNRPHSAETVWHRLSGYRDALGSSGIKPDPALAFEGDPADESFVRRILDADGLEACVCANDMTAANLMHSLDRLGVRIPDNLRIAGIDDVGYASLLRVPLTTIHQPCKYIGVSAVQAMKDRIADPNTPARDILLGFHLVVRESCGALLNKRSTVN